MATKFEKVLDTIHEAATVLARVTERRKKIDRETLIRIFHVTTTIAGAAALLMPQIKALVIAANVLGALGKSAEALVQPIVDTDATTPVLESGTEPASE